MRCCFYENANEVPDPRDLKSTDKNLMICNDKNKTNGKIIMLERDIVMLIAFI
jgi:hypothetical protein